MIELTCECQKRVLIYYKIQHSWYYLGGSVARGRLGFCAWQDNRIYFANVWGKYGKEITAVLLGVVRETIQIEEVRYLIRYT